MMRMLTPMFAQVIAPVRSAAASSVIVRALLITVLAIGVTVGGVLAGALVVAPVVSRAANVDMSHFDMSHVGLPRVTMAQAASLIADTRTRARSIVATLPEPVSRYAVPVLALISISGGLVALFARRSSRPTPPTLEVSDSLMAGRSTSRLTPRSAPRIHGKHAKTPRAVEALAASGASTTDIAWRTGLPIDAVRLLLSLSNVTRQLHPPTA